VANREPVPGFDAGAPEAGQAADAELTQPPGAPEDPTRAPPVPSCGLPPYQPVHLMVRDVMSSAGEPRGLAGAAISFKHCPGARFTTASDGRLTVQVSRDAETWIRFEADGYVPWLLGEVAVTESFPSTPVVATLVPMRLAASVVPPFRGEAALVYLQVQMGRATAPEACRSPAGVTFVVKDHPEATVLYRATGSNAGYSRAVATGEEGVALVVGLPPLPSVEVMASKPDCPYQLAYGDASAPFLVPILRTPLQAGTITHQVVNPIR
jgi:hypothetical protein